MLYLVYGYLILFIIRPFDNWEFFAEIRIERIYGALMVAAWLFSRNKRSIRCPQTFAIFALLAVMGLSFLFAYKPQLAWAEFYRYATLVVFYIVILSTIQDEAELRSFVVVYLCTMAAYQLLTLREYFFFGRGMWAAGIWRLVGYDKMLGHPNSLAASIVFSLPFAFWLLKQDSRWWIRLLIGGYTGLSLGCIVLTGSRSGLLGFLLLGLLYIASIPGKRKLYAVAIFAVLLALAFPLMPESMQARFRTLLGEHMNPGEQASAEGRITGWGFWQGLRMLRDRPLLGVGSGCFGIYSLEKLGGPPKDAHNLYGEVLGQLGVLGTLAFLCMAAIIFTNALTVVKQARAGAIPNDSPSVWIAYAIMALVILLFFEGWASHNLHRYNWLWAAAMATLAKDFAARRQETEDSLDSQKPVASPQPVCSDNHAEDECAQQGHDLMNTNWVTRNMT